MEFATLDRACWYNHRRLLGPLGYMPPAEMRASYFNQPHEPAIAGRLKQITLRETRGGSRLASLRQLYLGDVKVSIEEVEDLRESRHDLLITARTEDYGPSDQHHAEEQG